MEAEEGTCQTVRKLVLHFDINETIMVGDPVAGVNFAESLNNVLAKAAAVRFDDASGGYVWHDGSPLDPSDRRLGSEPPRLLTEFRLPPGCCRFFEKFRRHPTWPASRFTEPGMPGEIYRPIFEEMLEVMEWRHEPHPNLAHHGRHYLLPAFFHALRELLLQRREVAVVLRTFGTDLPEVAAAVSAFARGEHPDFPAEGASVGAFDAAAEAADAEGPPLVDLAQPCEAVDLETLRRLEIGDLDARWALRRERRQEVQSAIHMNCYAAHLTSEGYGKDLGTEEDPNGEPVKTLTAEEQIVDLIATSHSLGIRDDYHFWRGHRYTPCAGKPLWITLDDTSVQHIFFDDNIHDKADDSIVGVRVRPSGGGPFSSVSGETTRCLEGILLIKAQPVEAIRDQDYFLKQIARCEANFAAAIASEGGLSSIFAE